MSKFQLRNHATMRRPRPVDGFNFPILIVAKNRIWFDCIGFTSSDEMASPSNLF
jgi:hypothetical protein